MNLLKNFLRKSSILSLLLIALQMVAVAQPSCKATAPSQVSVGQNFNFSIQTSEKAKIGGVQFNHFNVLGGPNTSFSSSSSYVNGQWTKNETYTYSYVLQASKEGTFTVPGISVVMDGKQMKTNAVTITVVAASQQSQNGGARQGRQTQSQQAPAFDKSDVFVKAYASKSNPYVGEEVIITHKLYVGAGVNGGYNVTGVNAPSQKDCWTYTLGDPNADAPAHQETLNGKRYTVHEIRRTAVFPQSSGTLTITPFELDFVGRVIYRVQSNDPFDFFFGGGQRAQDYEWTIKSNSVNLNVKPLPAAGQPEEFNGVTGNLTLKATLSRNELKTNDATNLVVTVSGNGNLQHIEPLDFEFPSDFDVTDPKITDNINTRGNSVTGSRSFEYIIIPRSAGEFTIPAATFVYFVTKSKSYKSLQTPEFALKIEKGSGDAGVTSIASNKKDIKVLGTDIRFIKTTENAFAPKRGEFFATPWYFVILLLPFLLFVLFVVIWRKKIEERQNVAEMRNRKADKVARKRLKTAEKLLGQNKKEEFYVEISRVLWGYMSDKFKIPLAQLSMDTVEAKLKEKNLSDESIRDFLDTLNQCEFARFAPGDSSQMMQDMYELSRQFITKIEKQ